MTIPIAASRWIAGAPDCYVDYKTVECKTIKCK